MKFGATFRRKRLRDRSQKVTDNSFMEKSFPSAVTAIDTDEYGHQLVVATRDNEVTVFQASTMAVVSKIQLPNTPLAVDFSASAHGPLIAVGSSDGVRIFQNSRAVHTAESPAAVLAVAFHRSKCVLASASLDGTFSVFQRKTDGSWSHVSVSAGLMGLCSVCWGSDGDMLQTLIVGGVDGVVRVFKSAGGPWEISAAAQVHNGWVRCVAAPNVPLGSCQKIATCGDDGRACVVKVVNSQTDVSEVKPLQAPAGGVAWAMVDKTIVVAHANGETSTWKEDENGEWKKQ